MQPAKPTEALFHATPWMHSLLTPNLLLTERTPGRFYFHDLSQRILPFFSLLSFIYFLSLSFMSRFCTCGQQTRLLRETDTQKADLPLNFTYLTRSCT